MASPQKFLLLLYLLNFPTGRSDAQGLETRLGFIAGPGITSTNTRSDYGWKSLYGYSGGLVVLQEINRTIALETNVLYENKNFTARASLYDYLGVQIGSTDYRISFSSVSVPLMLNMHTAGKTSITCNAGVYLNYLFQNNTFIKDFRGQIHKFEMEIHRQNRYDGGLAIGLGFSRRFSERTSLKVELRNYIGLHNMNAKFASDEFYLNYHTTLISLNYKLGKLRDNQAN